MIPADATTPASEIRRIEAGDGASTGAAQPRARSRRRAPGVAVLLFAALLFAALPFATPPFAALPPVSPRGGATGPGTDSTVRVSRTGPGPASPEGLLAGDAGRDSEDLR